MQWSYTIGSVFGIPLKLHITFPMLIIGYAALFGYQYGWMAAFRGAILIFLLFICVILHELAHSKQAQRYGVNVRDVTLLPIGGVSNMEQIPEEPDQELKMALAGPLTSFAIGIVLLSLNLIFGLDVTEFNLEKLATSLGYLPVYLAWINIFLAVFNLLPAFPMDGGRVVRAYLAERMEFARATRIAASIGKIFAILFGIVGLIINPFLIFIAFFVYLGASSEEQSVLIGEELQRFTVRDVMNTQCPALPGNTSLSGVIERFFKGTCRNVIPIMEEGSYVGVVNQDDILSAIHEHGLHSEVGVIVKKEIPTVSPDDKLNEVYKKMQQNQVKAFAVMENGQLIGVISMEDLGRAYSLATAIHSHLKF